METTPVIFKTSIDCCQRFMMHMSGMSIQCINPLVNDEVVVHHDSEFTLYMKVIHRKWMLTNGSEPVLIVELGLANCFQNITELHVMMQKHGFPVG